jgi:O-antigen ligase
VIADAATPDYGAALDWLLPLMAATAVFFQIYIPTGSGRISVNLADPVVILGASLLVLHHFGKGWPAWRIPHLGIWIAASSTVILLSVLHGWASFGWTDWAFVNKGLGWLMLLCYGATGALIVGRAQQRGLEFLLKTLATSGAAIALLEIGFTVAVRAGIDLSGAFVEPRISGLSQNPNAFAFMLVLVLSAAIVLRERSSIRVGLMAVAMTGIWFTGSRAGILAVPAVIGTAWLMGVALWPLLVAALAAAACIAGVALLPFSPLPWQDFVVLARSDASTSQHLQTVQDGLAMFVAHPIFGAGLGAYMDEQLRTTGVPLMIHSTLVWLLAETGIAGTAVFLGAAWHLFSDALRRRGDPAAVLLLLALCALAVMSLAHEMLYQRAFWLLLGAVLAMPAVVTAGGGRFRR